MTQEEHQLLIENNTMLKQIIQYIKIKESNSQQQNNALQEFFINILANQMN